MRPPESLAARLERLVAAAQAEQRTPSVVAAVVRDGDVIWRTALGVADVARAEAATTAHAYRIGCASSGTAQERPPSSTSRPIR